MTRRLRLPAPSVAAALAAAAAVLAPAAAAACPSCVGNTQYANVQILMLAGFTALPFFMAAGVAWLIVRGAPSRD